MFTHQPIYLFFQNFEVMKYYFWVSFGYFNTTTCVNNNFPNISSSVPRNWKIFANVFNFTDILEKEKSQMT